MKRVFITGSNRGIGLGLVKLHLTRGDQVFAACRNPESAVALNKLQGDHGNALQVIPLDVKSIEAIKAASNTVAAFVDGLDLLYNNAGITGLKSPFGELDGDDIINTFSTNAVAPLMVIQTFADLLTHGNTPMIVNITSRLGSIADNGSGGWYGYRSSKAALNMINANLALDLKPNGVISIVIHPGWVQTDMGGSSATLTIDDSASGIASVADGLTMTDSGKFFAWNGEELPW